MKDTIIKQLKKIEQEEKIRILYAAESGSRAWGFASSDSDYDVRFIYIREREFYLKLEKTKDVIELPIDEVLDINGWDLHKALRLLHSSNPTLFEWCNSPIVYHTTPFFEELKTTIHEYFRAKAGLYHYLNMAAGNYREYLRGDVVKAKKYFYVLRPILACKWILREETSPPMQFTTLVETVLEEELKPLVYELLEMKMNLSEIGQIPKIQALNTYIEQNLASLKSTIQGLPDSRNADYTKLNLIFLKALEQSQM